MVPHKRHKNSGLQPGHGNLDLQIRRGTLSGKCRVDLDLRGVVSTERGVVSKLDLRGVVSTEDTEEIWKAVKEEVINKVKGRANR